MSLYTLYRDLDVDLPVCVKLGPTRSHKTRKERTLPCGHHVPAGTWYEVEAWVVDGEFQTDCRCNRCYEDLMG